MDSIKPHEDDVFYDKFGMRQWERRHCKVTEILENFSIKRVSFHLIELNIFRFVI